MALYPLITLQQDLVDTFLRRTRGCWALSWAWLRRWLWPEPEPSLATTPCWPWEPWLLLRRSKYFSPNVFQ